MIFVTLRVRRPKGMKGADLFVSGLVKRADARTVTLEVEHHATGPWDRDSVSTVTIERWRIRRASKEIPETV